MSDVYREQDYGVPGLTLTDNPTVSSPADIIKGWFTSLDIDGTSTVYQNRGITHLHAGGPYPVHMAGLTAMISLKYEYDGQLTIDLMMMPLEIDFKSLKEFINKTIAPLVKAFNMHNPSISVESFLLRLRIIVGQDYLGRQYKIPLAIGVEDTAVRQCEARAMAFNILKSAVDQTRTALGINEP